MTNATAMQINFLNVRSLFYLLAPSESMFETVEEVPEYTKQVKFKIFQRLLSINIDAKIKYCMLSVSLDTSYIYSFELFAFSQKISLYT